MEKSALVSNIARFEQAHLSKKTIKAKNGNRQYDTFKPVRRHKVTLDTTRPKNLESKESRVLCALRFCSYYFSRGSCYASHHDNPTEKWGDAFV